MTEQRILRLALLAGLFISLLGIGFGLWAGSFSILFDGMFGLVDALMTVISLVVAGLITRSVREGGLSRKTHQRFSMGFWHFEPMVLTLNGAILFSVAAYALVMAVQSLFAGGRDIEFGPAIAYAAIVVVLSALVAFFEHRANRTVRSQFVALDVKGWVMTGGISLALLIGFGIGATLDGTSYAWLRPYVDPGVLAIVCLVLLPVPVRNLVSSLSQLALVTPETLRLRVDAVAAEVSAEEGFLDHRAYLAQVGRSTQIELIFIIPTGAPARPVEEWDALRDRIADQIAEPSPHNWLTIAFTTDRRHAD